MDVVVFTIGERDLDVLLVRRHVAPFEGRWAIPGGFKGPAETLDEAARRELAEDMGVDGSVALRQFGAYGDPGGDPRMNVVTVAYFAVLRAVERVVADTDAVEAALGVWDVRLDEANFRRSLLADEGWVVPTGRRAAPGREAESPPSSSGPGRAGRRAG